VRVEAGSALDVDYLESLGQFDVVYSWACCIIPARCGRAGQYRASGGSGGKLFIAIYNDQGTAAAAGQSKEVYNEAPRGLRFLAVCLPFGPLLATAGERLPSR